MRFHKLLFVVTSTLACTSSKLFELLFLFIDSTKINILFYPAAFHSINNLQGLNILTDEMDLNIKPTFSKIKYYNRFKVNEDWIFCLFEITDTLGNTYFMGENKKEYISK